MAEVVLSAVIFETFISVMLIIVFILILLKYIQRRKKPVLYLLLTFASFSLASLTSAIGRWLGYFLGNETIGFTDLSNMTAFLLLALSNCFVVAFVETVFANKGVDFAITFLVINGIVIGMSMEAIIYWFSDTQFGLLAKKFYIIVLLAIISLVTYIILVVYAFKEAKMNTEKLPKTGFNLIAAYGISVSLLFVCFALDSVMASLGKGYSPFYYMGWSFAMVGVFLGYLGYIMPGWLKNIIQKSS
ncbi:MAG: hypothetical protein HeimAB125_06450 [Candidatus Heimdallarchaeota archaeon AB_125]|nr:MAG: hypothetical protein HeimAB125_06450 [Candidatus Heimdallarchaeota archaeon AB_125]